MYTSTELCAEAYQILCRALEFNDVPKLHCGIIDGGTELPITLDPRLVVCAGYTAIAKYLSQVTGINVLELCQPEHALKVVQALLELNGDKVGAACDQVRDVDHPAFVMCVLLRQAAGCLQRRQDLPSTASLSLTDLPKDISCHCQRCLLCCQVTSFCLDL